MLYHQKAHILVVLFLLLQLYKDPEGQCGPAKNTDDFVPVGHDHSGRWKGAITTPVKSPGKKSDGWFPLELSDFFPRCE